MIVKQYSLNLPADYDMRIIRARVATRGAATDDLAGLFFKAYLIREKGRSGARGNEYAPFYVWENTEALWDFVANENGFLRIVESFGWTPIRQWLSLDVAAHRALDLDSVRSATREERAILPGTNLVTLRADEIASNRDAFSNDPRIAARVVAVDVHAWQLVRTTLWRVADDALPADDAGDRFQVLHLSAPTLRA